MSPLQNAIHEEHNSKLQLFMIGHAQLSLQNVIMEFGEAIKNPAYRIFQTEYSGCLDISAHA